MSPNIYLGLYVDKLSTSYMPAIVDNIGIVDCNVKVLSCVLCTKICGELDSAIISCSKQIFHRRIVSIFRVNVFVREECALHRALCEVSGSPYIIHQRPQPSLHTVHTAGGGCPPGRGPGSGEHISDGSSVWFRRPGTHVSSQPPAAPWRLLGDRDGDGDARHGDGGPHGDARPHPAPPHCGGEVGGHGRQENHAWTVSFHYLLKNIYKQKQI